MADTNRQPIVFLPDGIAQCMACENICDMNADLVTIEAAELKRLRAIKDDLLAALKTLLKEAENFGVSGVYFTEDCMGHKGPDLARAAIDKAQAENV